MASGGEEPIHEEGGVFHRQQSNWAQEMTSPRRESSHDTGVIEVKFTASVVLLQQVLESPYRCCGIDSRCCCRFVLATWRQQ